MRLAPIDDVIMSSQFAIVPHTTSNNTSHSGYATFQACRVSLIVEK